MTHIISSFFFTFFALSTYAQYNFDHAAEQFAQLQQRGYDVRGWEEGPNGGLMTSNGMSYTERIEKGGMAKMIKDLAAYVPTTEKG